MSYYDYPELRAKAVQTRAQADIDALGEWFANYGSDFWNGEYYDAEDGLRLRRVEEPESFDENGEVDCWKVVGYELY